MSIGQVEYFLRQVTDQNDPKRVAILESLRLASLPSPILDKLVRLIKEYRNPASHGNEPFAESKLDNLRWELFGGHLLRDLLEHLHAIDRGESVT